MTNLKKAKVAYDEAHKDWFNTSIYAPKEQKDKVDNNLRLARVQYDEAYKKEFPNHEILHF